MTKYFADTHYWVALLRPTDQWRSEALAVTARLRPEIVTTDEVLVETLNFMSEAGASLRVAAAELVRGLLTSTAVQVIPQTHASFLEALAFYESRQDKGYSLVDCVSMLAMRDLGIDDVLTGDHHFAQEGFRPLLAR